MPSPATTPTTIPPIAPPLRESFEESELAVLALVVILAPARPLVVEEDVGAAENEAARAEASKVKVDACGLAEDSEEYIWPR